MNKRILPIILTLFLLQLPLAIFVQAAKPSLPSQIMAYDESFYYSYQGEEGQGSGSLITYKQQSFIPLTSAASLLGMNVEQKAGDLHLTGKPTIQLSKTVSTLSKDKTIADTVRINPAIGAQAGIVIEDDHESPIFSKNIGQRLYPSSTQKLMTALLALENGKLNEKVKVSANVSTIPRDSSKAGLLPGDQLTLEQLLYGLLLPSGNDAAIAIAEHISGSEQQFVQLMNKRAKELGAAHTHFVNSHGYHHPNQQTTAADLAKIAKEVAKYPAFMKIINSPTYYANYKDKNGKLKAKTWKNTNKLIQKDSSYYTLSVIGGKTGYTSASKYNLVTFAHENDHNYIVVLLRGENNQRFVDTRTLLQSAYKERRLADQSNKVSMSIAPVRGQLYVNGENITERIAMFSKNGVTYVSVDILTTISPAISTVTRSERQQMKAALNSTLLSFDRVEPTVKNGRMLVPVRTFFEAAGLELKWDPATKTIEGRSADTSITMNIDSTKATVNGKQVTLDVPATVQNGRTLVPIRFVSEATGAKIDWGRGRVLYLR